MRKKITFEDFRELSVLKLLRDIQVLGENSKTKLVQVECYNKRAGFNLILNSPSEEYAIKLLDSASQLSECIEKDLRDIYKSTCRPKITLHTSLLKFDVRVKISKEVPYGEEGTDTEDRYVDIIFAAGSREDRVTLCVPKNLVMIHISHKMQLVAVSNKLDRPIQFCY